ncbi:unnamed protein product [Orchesella dallaii]|uniref:Uncharacterized protein n=1 Tax=Orchesella dallaii TaxID=48710 RepID=A0ABP1R5Z8_9HEXA
MGRNKKVRKTQERGQDQPKKAEVEEKLAKKPERNEKVEELQGAFSNAPASSPNKAAFTQVASELLPILLDSGYLPRKSILSCRQLNKGIKASVDKELLGPRKPSWLTSAFTLSNTRAILNFMKKAEGMRSSGGTLTPLFAWTLNLASGTYNVKTQELLQKYGPLLLKLRLAITHNQDRPIPFSTHVNMTSALRCLPNILSLALAFEKICLDDYESYWHDLESFDGPHLLPHLLQLPALKGLSELSVELLAEPESQEFFLAPPVELIQPLLKSYGIQLAKFSCHKIFLQPEYGDDEDIIRKQIFKSFLKNLRDLTITGFSADEDEDDEETLQILAQAKLPKLKRMAFFRDENEDEEEDFSDEESDGEVMLGDNERDLLCLLGRFSDTLEEVRLYKLYDDGLSAIGEDVKPLPKVKGLTLSADNLNSDVWNSFRTQFPNLEWVCFEMGQILDATSSSAVKGFDEKQVANAALSCPFPDIAKRKRFFANFPKLKSLTWNGRGSGASKKKTVTFSRPASSQLATSGSMTG